MAHKLHAVKKFKPDDVKQEPVDFENDHGIMLPELHIKDEYADWQMDGFYNEKTGSEQNAAFSAAGEPLEKTHVTNHSITDPDGSIKYDDLKKDLKLFIETTVEEVVERCFQKHFAQLIALFGSSLKSTAPVTEPHDDINSESAETENEMDAENLKYENKYEEVVRVKAESPPLQESNELRLEENMDEDVPEVKHVKITNEHGLAVFDEKLNDEEYFNKYVGYFDTIIVPNSNKGKGDYIGSIVASHLFGIDLWEQLTWAGYKKANNTKASFCIFRNVIRLLFRLITIGDPTYNEQKLEWFIRRRLLMRTRRKLKN